MIRWFLLCSLWLAASCVHPHAVQVPSTRAPSLALAWQPWSAAIFEKARRERKLILLSVQADFCHWCHVMNATTYRDAQVLKVLHERYVLLRVDQAQRPDLAARYADYGWPATALLTPDAQPIVTLRGHQPTESFLPLLQSLVAELSTRGTVSARNAVPPSQLGNPSLQHAHVAALSQLDALYDAAEGGWGGPQKYPFSAPVQHALLRAHVAGEPTRLTNALATLRGHARLIDPVAGGMFQYSTGGSWTRPHYEKLAEIQAKAMLDFAEAYRATHDPRWADEGMRIARYVLGTLRLADGCFAASQAADVGTPGDPDFVAGATYYARSASERAGGKPPPLNTHIYANLNGMLIRGLVALHRANGEPLLLSAALACQNRLASTHLQADAFAHEPGDDSFYLGDQVEMIDALLALADATDDPQTRVLAYRVMDFAVRQLEDQERGGFYANTGATAGGGVFAERLKPAADNAHLAQLLLMRARREHDAPLRETAERALSGQSGNAELRAQGRKVGDTLLALESDLAGYVMFSIVGPKDDPRTRALHEAAYRSYAPNGLLRSDEPGQGNYPYLGRPSIYLCSDSACSSPVFEPEKLQQAVNAFIEDARQAH